MKKLIATLSLMILCASLSFALVQTEVEYNASGDLAATVTLDDQSAYGRYVIWSIFGDSDKSTAVITIQKADATGVTTSYTTVATLPQTNSSLYSFDYNNDTYPVFVGDLNYRYKIVLDSTTANSLVVNYTKE
jgi:hypothetical protein